MNGPRASLPTTPARCVDSLRLSTGAWRVQGLPLAREEHRASGPGPSAGLHRADGHQLRLGGLVAGGRPAVPAADIAVRGPGERATLQVEGGGVGADTECAGGLGDEVRRAEGRGGLVAARGHRGAAALAAIRSSPSSSAPVFSRRSGSHGSAGRSYRANAPSRCTGSASAGRRNTSAPGRRRRRRTGRRPPPWTGSPRRGAVADTGARRPRTAGSPRPRRNPARDLSLAHLDERSVVVQPCPQPLVQLQRACGGRVACRGLGQRPGDDGGRLVVRGPGDRQPLPGRAVRTGTVQEAPRTAASEHDPAPLGGLTSCGQLQRPCPGGLLTSFGVLPP